MVAGDEGAVLEMADRKVIDMDDPPAPIPPVRGL